MNINLNQHQPNIVRNQAEVDDMIDAECEPKHLNFDGIPEEGPAANNSPFKEPGNDKSLGSAMKGLGIQSNRKKHGRRRKDITN